MVEPLPSLVLNYFLHDHDVPPLFPNKTKWFPKKFLNLFILLQNLTNLSKLNFKQTITPISTFLLKRLWKIQAASRTLGSKTSPTSKTIHARCPMHLTTITLYITSIRNHFAWLSPPLSIWTANLQKSVHTLILWATKLSRWVFILITVVAIMNIWYIIRMSTWPSSQRRKQSFSFYLSLSCQHMIFQMTQLIAVRWQWTSYICCMPPSTKWKTQVRLHLLSSSSTLPISSTVLDPGKLPSSTPFHRTDNDSNEYKFIVHTAPLFCNFPNPKNLTVTPMSLDDLKNKSSKLTNSLLSHTFIITTILSKSFLPPQNQQHYPHPTPCNDFQTPIWLKAVRMFPTN